MITNILAGVLGSALIMVAFAWTGSADYDTAKREEAIYIEMVCADAWGDYKELKPDCSKRAM